MVFGRVKYTIVLPAEKTVYYPGEIIKGQLHIRSSSPPSLSGLELQLTGKAKVMLVRREHKSETRFYRTETYMETRKPVQNFERLTADNLASPNTSVLEFGFFLPLGLPPSFVSPLKSNGYLRYVLQLKKTDRGREKLLRTTKITVAPYLTFEKIPSAGNPIARDRHGASPICCCGARRDITVRVWLDRAGVFAGTIIPFHALIINNSNHSIRSSFLTLNRHWVFRTSQRTDQASENVGSFRKTKRGTIPPGGTMTWGDNDPPVALPSGLIPTGPPGCSSISVSYELVFTVVPAGMAENMHLFLPILVGGTMPEPVQEEVKRNISGIYLNLLARDILLRQLAANTIPNSPADQ